MRLLIYRYAESYLSIIWFEEMKNNDGKASGCEKKNNRWYSSLKNNTWFILRKLKTKDFYIQMRSKRLTNDKFTFVKSSLQ